MVALLRLQVPLTPPDEPVHDAPYIAVLHCVEEVHPVHLPEVHVSPLEQSPLTLQALVQVPVVAPVHCSVTPQAALEKQALAAHVPTPLHELLAQLPALVHLQIPLTHEPAGQGFEVLQLRAAQVPVAVPVQLSMFPHSESCQHEAAVPLHAPLLATHELLAQSQLWLQWHFPSDWQVPALHLPELQGAGLQVPANWQCSQVWQLESLVQALLEQ